MSKRLEWCPKGCGKSVIFLFRDHKKNQGVYKCARCDNKFYKDELFAYWGAN